MCEIKASIYRLNIDKGVIMSRIKYLLMDVDGTLTDGKIYLSNHGELFKAFNTKDGYGIHDLLIPAGIIPVVVSGRVSEIVNLRCIELGITMVIQGVVDKSRVLSALTNDFSEIAYIGDEVNDLVCMEQIKKAGGIIGCPLDASEKVKRIVDFISTKRGGEGAVRDFIEWVIKAG